MAIPSLSSAAWRSHLHFCLCELGWVLGPFYRVCELIRTVDGAWFNNSRSFEGETNQELTPSPSDKAGLRKSTKHRPGQPGGLGSTWLRGQVDTVSTWKSTWVTQVDYPVDLGALGGNFPTLANTTRFWILNWFFWAVLVCLNFKLNSETSRGHIFFIRSPFYANSDSISSRIPRRTQWRIPFPLIL